MSMVAYSWVRYWDSAGFDGRDFLGEVHGDYSARIPLRPCQCRSTEANPEHGSGISERRLEATSAETACYCQGFISVLLGSEASSTLCAVSAPAMGRPSGSSRPS
jgi:hypothetical protein